MCFAGNITEVCQAKPKPKLYNLQSDCYLVKNKETTIDIGHCPRAQCVSSSEDGVTCSANYYAQGQGQCCEPIRVEIISERVYCELQQEKDVKFSIVKECGCRPCSDNMITVSGYVTSNEDVPLEYVDVVRNKRVDAISNEKGYYVFVLSHRTLVDRRVVLTFNDPSGKHFAMTKSIQITTATHYTLNIRLPKYDAIFLLNATEGREFSLGYSPSQALAIVKLVPASFYYLDGFEYRDEVAVSVKWVEPSDDADPPFLPSDLMAVDPSGNISGLSSFGMFAIQFQSSDGHVLSTSEGIQIFVNSDNVGDDIGHGKSSSKLWVLNPDTGFWEFASDLSKDNSSSARAKRETQTVFVGQVRISADRLWINIDQPFPMCLVKVRAFASDQFKEPEQISDVEVTVIAMNPPRIGNQEWRWGRIESSMTHERQGACVTTICDIENGKNWGYIKARRAGQPLLPADPNTHRGKTGLRQYENILDYEVLGDTIKTNLVHINSPPFYFYAQYLLCYRERFSDPHFRFYSGSEEKCQFEHTVLTEPQFYFDAPVGFNHLAWYPRANPEHFYEVCYIKLSIGPSFIEKGPTWKQYDEVKRAMVYGGGPTVIVLESLVGNIQGNASVLRGDPFGSRSQCAGTHKTACIEFKKSGMAVDRETVIETELRGYVELSRCGLQVNKNVMDDYPSVAEDRHIPITMVGSKYGIYCEKGPVLSDVKTDALRHCYAGSDVRTSTSMVAGVGIGATFCPDWCGSEPCQNNGTCRMWEFSYNCACTEGFRGKHCECKIGEDC